ncbi:hypothetical protein ACFY00_20225 [Kitasatospora sp. NPDC001540]|uniref:hypothetical protein n=1 Tax=Kitasatospora sp. NPDC001540 TaxID=3364014 RepID=UPI003688F121
MHILDDLTGLSARARSLLERTGWRDDPQEPRLSTEFLQVRDRFGQLAPTPTMLVIRREGFEQKYGGLRYRVRSSCTVGGERSEVLRDWHYDLGQGMWAEPAGGWYFDWFGERVSSPVRYLVHTDGRVGVDDGGGTFLEIAPSVPALIESHALTDALSTWDRTTAEVDGFAPAERLDGLTDVPEASGSTIRWRLSENVAVKEFRDWSSGAPRRWRAFVWSREASPSEDQCPSRTSSGPRCPADGGTHAPGSAAVAFARRVAAVRHR